MPIYEEAYPKPIKTIFFLALAFLLIFAPWSLVEKELYSQEGLYLTIASEIAEQKTFPPLPIAHGELIHNAYPLYPYLIYCLYKLGIPMIFALRILPLFTLAILCVIVFETGRRAVDIQVAAVACAMLTSNMIVMEKADMGSPLLLMILFLFSGWLSWFSFGPVRNRWDLAWIISSFFCGIAYLSAGWIAILYFFFPFLFMRRPLTIWPKLWKSNFFTGGLIIIFFILFKNIPAWIITRNVHFSSILPSDYSFFHYLKHLLLFPFSMGLRILPWTLLAWAPFCVAFHPLDRAPLFSRFLRTIVISIFFLIWFSPHSEVEDIIILLPPLCVLTGINYWLTCRRYGHVISSIFINLNYILIFCSFLAFVYFIVPFEGIMKFIASPERIKKVVSLYFFPGIIYSTLALILSVISIYFKKQNSIRIFEYIVVQCVILMLIYRGVFFPYKVVVKYSQRSKSFLARQIRKVISEDFGNEKNLIIYKAQNISGLYNECFYTGFKVKKIYSVKDIPETKKVVYLLVYKDFTPGLKRKWQKLISLQYKKGVLSVYKGIIKESLQGEK